MHQGPETMSRGPGCCYLLLRTVAALLPHAHRDLDRGAREAELLAESALDEAAVSGLEEARGEQDEARGLRRGLGAEQDPGLLAAAHGVGVLGDQRAEEGVELAGGDAGLPALQRGLDRGDELVHVASRARRDVDPRRPLDLDELLLDLALQVVPALVVELVPLVVGDDE